MLVDMSSVDWDQLRQQKLELITLLETQPTSIVHGLVYLLDYIQDEAASEMGEQAIFGDFEDES